MTFCRHRLDLVGVVPVPVAAQAPQVPDRKEHTPVALDLLQMLAFVAQQALVVLVSWQHVDGVPEAGPASEPAGSHVPGYQASGCLYSSHVTPTMTADQKASRARLMQT